MKLTANRLRALKKGEYLIVFASELRTGIAQGEVSSLMTRSKPYKFIQKMFLMFDPNDETLERCWKITRIK